HATCSRADSEIGAIVQDHQRTVRLRTLHDRARDVEQPGRRHLLGSDLQEGSAAVETGGSEVVQRPAGTQTNIRVADDVERRRYGRRRWDRYAASASRPPGRGRASSRSMKEVLSLPATKSGSLRILR